MSRSGIERPRAFAHQVQGQRLQPEAFKMVRTISDVVDALHALVTSGGTVDA